MFAFPYQHKGALRIHKVFLFGGAGNGGLGVNGDATSFSDKIYQWDGTNLLIKAKMNTGLSVASSCQVGTNACIFGGTNSSNYWLSSIRKYDGSTYSAGTETLSSAMNHTSAVALSGVGYIFGGNTGTESNAIQSYNGTVRSTTAYTLSTTLQATAACKIQNGGSVEAVIFGGWTTNFTEVATIQRFTGSARSNAGVSLPAALAEACAASPEDDNYPCWVFGGKMNSTIYTTINEYNNSTVTTRSATLTAANAKDCAAGFNSDCFIYGGNPTLSVRKWDGTNLTTVSASQSGLFDKATACTLNY